MPPLEFIYYLNLTKHITNISGLQFFQLFRFGILLLISILLAKNLDTVQIGTYELLILIAGAVSYFWVSGIIKSLLPLYNNNKSISKGDSKSAELFNTFIMLLIISGIVVLILVLFNGQLAEAMGNRTKIPHIGLFAWYILFSGPANLAEYIYLLRNKPKAIIVYGTVAFTVQLVLVGLPAIMQMGIEYCIAGLTLAAGLRFLWLLIMIARHARIKISLPYIKEHLSLAFPLVLSLLLSGSAQYIDGFLVSYNFNEATLAIFKYGARELPFAILLADAFSNAMLPSFSADKDLNSSLNLLKKKSGNLMHILYPVSMLLILTSYWLYPLVFNSNFLESASVFNLYLLLIISRLVFPQTILIGMKRTNIILIASLMELIINVTLSIIFIGIWGIAGVALATVIAYLFEKLVLIAYNKIALGIRPSAYIPLLPQLIYTLAILGIYILVDYDVLIKAL